MRQTSFFSLLLAFVLIMGLVPAAATTAAAAAPWPDGCVVLMPDSLTAHTDSGLKSLDVAAFIDGNNRLLVPIRFITEGLGASVSFVAPQITVVYGDRTVVLELGKASAKVNGKDLTMDTMPVLLSNRTFVPLRFLAESCNLFVHYLDGVILVGTREAAPTAAEASMWKANLKSPEGELVSFNGVNFILLPNLNNYPHSKSDYDVLEIACSVLSILENKDWGALLHMIHPAIGLTFSPYGYVDPASALCLGAGDVFALGEDDSIWLWGFYAGSGNTIELPFADYYDEFIISHEFRQVAIDRVVRTNMLSNLYVFGNGGAFVDFYYPGDPGELQDFTWASLRMVFSDNDGELYLVALVHDQWTP